ncbi:MAG: nusB [Alphaproteobacteria bacterium]|nr:nusB [Alphaproteobacteria bacterium]
MTPKTPKARKSLPIPIVKRQIKGSAKARRNASRLAAVQCLYQMRQNGMNAEQALGDYAHNRMGLEEDGNVYVAADMVLLRGILTGVEERMDLLTEMMGQALNNDRSLASQEQLIQCILLCGAEELFAHPETDTALILANYVEVGKAFYEGREPGMINAALDALAKVIRPKTE